MLDVCLLGTGGMMPLPKRYLTALLVRHNGKSILIDCGEATQVPLYQSSYSVKDIDHILFTHFHGDHTAGLPGLLMTMGNSMRTEDLHLWGGAGLERVVKGLTVICNHLPFKIVCHELPWKEQSVFQAGELMITAQPVKHSVPCLCYSLYLPRIGKFDVEKAKALDLPVIYWKHLQRGENVEFEGKTFTPEMVMGPTRRGLKVSYATDCRPSADIVKTVADSDLFVAEGLYGDEEKWQSAKEKGHMIYREAAQMALEANVGELWFTHYSPAMTNPHEFLDKAREIFSNAYCGSNLKERTLRFKDEDESDA